MYPTYIYPKITGVPGTGLVIDDDGYRWSSRRPPESWSVRGELLVDESSSSVDELAKLESRDLTLYPDEKWRRSVPTTDSSINPSWKLLMPSVQYASYLRGVTERVSSFLETSDVSYYVENWIPHRKVFSAITRMIAPGHQMFSDPEGFNVSSFKPRGGWCDRIVYNRFGTRTGRLTVSSGPNILTLRRDLRKFLKSRHGENGVLLQVDFSALEVRLLAADLNKCAPAGDPYQSLADELGISRKSAKLALISTTYGSSERGVANSLDISLDEAHRIVGTIQRKHAVVEQVSRLRSEFNQTGFIRNRYGRKVGVPDPSDGPLLNSYLQSTGVDVALWGFLQVIERLPEGHAVPIALIHDAMVLDVTKEFASKIGGSLLVKVPGYEGKFPLKIEQVC